MTLQIQKFQKAVRIGREQLADAILPRHAWIRTQTRKMKGEDMLCDACGKSMTMPNGKTTLIGIQIELVPGGTMDEPDRQWYAEQMAPFDLNHKYRICFPCWLHSLGVRPDCPVNSPVPGDPLIVY